MVFHGKKIRISIVSFTYFILSLSDFCTGFCSFLHTCIFIVFDDMKGDMTFSVYGLILPAYFLTVVAFKISAFVSMMIAVLRTMHIVFPFKRIRKRAVVIAIGMYTVFWVVIFSLDLGILLDTYLGFLKVMSGELTKNVDSEYIVHESMLTYYFFMPNRPQWVELLGSKYGMETLILNCPIEMIYSVTPFLLCAIITAFVTAVQLKVLIFPPGPASDDCEAAKRNKKKEMRKITITVVLINICFLFCTSLSLLNPIHEVCMHPNRVVRNYRMTYSMGYLPFFLNAAVNPLILFIRIKAYRKFVVQKIVNVFKKKHLDGDSTSTTNQQQRYTNTELTTLFHVRNSATLPTIADHGEENNANTEHGRSENCE